MFKIDNTKVVADIGYMEYKLKSFMSRGIRIGDLNTLYQYYNTLRENIKNEIVSNYNIQNPNSSQQIIMYLRNLADQVELGAHNDIISICVEDDTGKWTTKAEAMEKLADLGYDIASDILDYRKAKKYADSIKELMTFADRDNLIHPSVSLTKTNRITYSKPGLMSVPKKLLWNVIVPYNDNDVLFSVDIKNQEPNILINYLADDSLKSALRSDKGLYEELFERVFKPTVEMNMIRDILSENKIYSVSELRSIPFVAPAKYLPKRAECKSLYYNNERIVAIETFCQGYNGGEIIFPDKVTIETEERQLYELDVVWQKDYKVKKTGDFVIKGDIQGVEFRLSPAERKEFKTAWNALSYGASSFGISKMCKIIDGKKVYNYFNNLDSFKRYRKAIEKIVNEGKTCVSTVFGNVVYAGYDKVDKKALKRTLLDLPIQGTGADILSCLIRHFEDEVKNRGLEHKMFIYYTRHDELIIEVNKDLVESNKDFVIETLKDLLEHQVICNGKEWEPFKIEIEMITSGDLSFSDEL